MLGLLSSAHRELPVPSKTFSAVIDGVALRQFKSDLDSAEQTKAERLDHGVIIAVIDHFANFDDKVLNFAALRFGYSLRRDAG
jgi:hypothetical protein